MKMEEAQQQAERMLADAASEITRNGSLALIWDTRAILKHIPLAKLILAESERDELKAKVDKFARLIDLSQKANDEKSEREIASSATFLEAIAHTNTEIVEQECDTLRAQLEAVTKELAVVKESRATAIDQEQKSRNECNRIRQQHSELLSAAGALYEWVQFNDVRRPARKEIMNRLYDALDKGVKGSLHKLPESGVV